MPPWQIERSVGIQKFKNDRSLTDDERLTVLKWIDDGAPQGDPKDMPPPVSWPEDQGWNFAAQFGQKEPDLIVKSEPFTMPALAQDAWDHRVTQSGLTEPRWVRAIEIRPSTVKGRRITHHAIAYLEQQEGAATGTPAPGGLGGFFMEWAVGKQGELMRPDTGKLLLPGATVPLGRPLLTGRRRDHQPGGDGPLLLPEGTGAEVPHLICRSCRQRSARWTFARTPCRSSKGSRHCATTRASRVSSHTCTCAARR